MPRTQVPEEGQRVVNVSELKNTKPRLEAVIRTEGESVTNDGLSNLYWWDPNGNPSNADGETIIESSVSGYQNGEANEGVWRRMFVPSSQLSGDGLSYRSSDQKLDVRLPIDQGGSNVTSAYSFNYTSVFELIDDGSGQVTIGLNQGDSSGLNADTLDGVELADISFSDIAAEKYTDEEAQDAVGNIVSGGTDITTTYDDPNNAVTVNHANTGAADSTNSGSTVLQSLTSDGRGHVETISTATFSAGDGLSLNGTTFNTRLDIDESGSNVTSAYAFNFSTDINVIDDGGNQITVKHADTGSASSTNSGETVIQSLSSDNRGHVETISTKTLSAGEGLSFSSGSFDVRLDIDSSGSNVTSAYALNFGSNFNIINDGSNQATVNINESSLVSATGSAGAVQYASSSSKFLGNVNYLYVDDSNGNVGVGTTTPSHKLDVNGNANVSSNLDVGGDATISEALNVQDFTFDQSSGDLVLSNSDGVELIRQPADGNTKFVQGAEIDSINAPEDSFTQIINASSTSAASSGDPLGYTFAINDQSVLEIKAEADGSGGITNKTVNFPSEILEGGDGLVSNSGKLDVRLDIDEDGSNVTTAYALNFGSGINVADDGSNQVTVSVDPGAFTSASGNQGAVQYSDGNGGFIGNKNYLYIDSSNGDVSIGKSLNVQDFTFDQDSGDFVLSNNGGVELIRQPSDGNTKFVQGADMDSINAPEDSFTQLINADITDSTSSGDPVGYTFAVNNNTFIEVKADADGNGGITNKRVSFPSDVATVGASSFGPSDVATVGASSFGNFDIQYNSNSESLDFVYIK